MLRLLILAAAVQMILGSIPQISDNPSRDWVEGFSIILAVVVVVSVGSITNWSKEKAFKELNKRSQEDLEVSLIRNGKAKQFHPDNILVGEIFSFSGGKTIPVDGLILSATDVEMDESPLTGESQRMKKEVFEEVLKEAEILISKNASFEKISSYLVFSGTKCVKGQGCMLVLRVGKNSEIGKIEGRISGENSKNTLEAKLDSLAGDIGKVGIVAALITFVALIIRFGVSFGTEKASYDKFVQQMANKNITSINPNITYNFTLDDNSTIVTNAPEDPTLLVGKKILNIVLLCIAIIVVAIPEGLPLAVTLSLAFAIGKMQKQNNLVRSMTSCELWAPRILCAPIKQEL
jgi:magnesium-transporting ATPase (P-type)